MIINKTNKNEKTSFFENISEPTLYPMLKEMGYAPHAIEQFQKRRVILSLGLWIFLMILGLFLAKWFYIIAFLFSFLIYKGMYKIETKRYSVWKFQRHLQFSKFTRLLIPYLKQSKGKTSLYTIFNKILMRTENEADKNALYTLMSEMSNRPGDIQPFIDFAEKSSGSDMSVLFMSTIFDFQQSTFDTSVIDELGKLASEELMVSIDEIIEFKLSRFMHFPTKITMSSFLFIVGFAISMFIHYITSMNFF